MLLIKTEIFEGTVNIILEMYYSNEW